MNLNIPINKMTDNTVTVSPEVQIKERKKAKRIIYIVLRTLISTVLIYWILKGTNFNAIIHSIGSADFVLITFAFLLHFLGYYISAVRWKLLLHQHGADAKIGYLIKSYMVSTFFNNILPTTVGGDTVRMYDSYKAGTSKSGAVAVVFVDRFLGLSALIIFAFITIFIVDEVTARIPYLFLWVIIVFLLMVFVIWLIFFPSKKLSGFVNKIKIPFSQKLQRIMEKLVEAFWGFKVKKIALFKALGLSFLLQMNVVVYYFLIAAALDFSIPLYNFFLIVPLSIFIMMLPVTINGIGLRENVFFFFFSVYAVAKPESIAFAWIEYGMIIALGVIGGIVYMTRK